MPTPTARQQKIAAYYPVARAIAKQVSRRLPRAVDLDDLIGAATLGLVDAVDRFDPSKNLDFDRYARFRMKGAVIDSLRRDDWVPRTVRLRARALENAKITLRRELGAEPTREHVADALNLPVAELDDYERHAEIRQLGSLDAPPSEGHTAFEPVDDDATADETTEERELCAAMHRRLGRLPEREQAALRMYYLEERPLREVGARMGVSESRACQLTSRGVELMRVSLAR